MIHSKDMLVKLISVFLFFSSGAFADPPFENSFNFLGVYSGNDPSDPELKAVLDFDIEESNFGKGLIRIKYLAQSKNVWFPELGSPKVYALVSLDDYQHVFENLEPIDHFDSGWYLIDSIAEDSNWKRIQNFPKLAHYRIIARDRGQMRRVEIFYRMGGGPLETEKSLFHPTKLILKLQKASKGWEIQETKMASFQPRFRLSDLLHPIRFVSSVRFWLKTSPRATNFKLKAPGLSVVESMFGRTTKKIVSPEEIAISIGPCPANLKTLLSY